MIGRWIDRCGPGGNGRPAGEIIIVDLENMALWVLAPSQIVLLIVKQGRKMNSEGKTLNKREFVYGRGAMRERSYDLSCHMTLWISRINSRPE